MGAVWEPQYSFTFFYCNGGLLTLLLIAYMCIAMSNLLLAVILSWLVDKIQRAIKSDQIIEEKKMECQQERVIDAVVDEIILNVDIHLVRAPLH